VSLAVHAIVVGAAISSVEIVSPSGAARSISWADLSATRLDEGAWRVRFVAPAADAIEIPPCAGRGRVSVAGTTYAPPLGPFVVRASGAVEMEIQVSAYEHRIACGYAPRAGSTSDVRDGLTTDGRAVVFVPRGHDTKSAGAVLVGLHPWDGSIWTYANYTELLEAAQKRDIVLLFPSGLGNSLYTRAAEEEVMRALASLESAIAVDPQRVSIFGASMGGAGATTIGFHHPDRFATITSLFGDSKYDLSTYVRSILPTPAAAHLVNALDVVDSVRHVPVWLVHGDADRVSPIEQSAMLARALEKLHYAVRFDRVSGAGHEGALVAKNAAEIVERAATMKAPQHPARVTFSSVRDEDVEAYGVKITRAGPGDAFIDVEIHAGAVTVHAARNVREILLRKGALGAAGSETAPAIVRFER